jgi:putative ABC transport system ATP-binding protein
MSVELRDVHKVYPADPPVHSLRGLTLSIASHEQVAVLGASGSGKSTLLNLIAALDRPTSGTVRVNGVDLTALGDRALSGLRAHHIGVVFQQFHLFESMTTVDNVATGLLYRGEPAALRRERAASTLARVGLADRAEHRPNKLSGGERQRVAIARAIVGRPGLLIADEPTGNLDSTTGAQILALLHDLGRDGCTLIVITHDQRVAASLHRRIELRDGQIIADTTGTPR